MFPYKLFTIALLRYLMPFASVRVICWCCFTCLMTFLLYSRHYGWHINKDYLLRRLILLNKDSATFLWRVLILFWQPVHLAGLKPQPPFSLSRWFRSPDQFFQLPAAAVQWTHWDLPAQADRGFGQSLGSESEVCSFCSSFLSRIPPNFPSSPPTPILSLTSQVSKAAVLCHP